MKIFQKILIFLMSIVLILPSYPVSAEGSLKQSVSSAEQIQEKVLTEESTALQTNSNHPHQNLTMAVTSVYADKQLENELEQLKNRTLELSVPLAELSARGTSEALGSKVATTSRDLIKEEIDWLVRAGAGIKDIYWVNLLIKESSWTPKEIYEYKVAQTLTWEMTETSILEKSNNSELTVNDVVYEEDLLELTSPLKAVTVQDSVYDSLSIEDKQFKESARASAYSSFELFAAAVASSLDGLSTQQMINQTNKQQYADRTGTSEVIDPASGSLTWKQNQISLPGRDGLDLNIGVMYNSNQSFSYMRDRNSEGQIKRYNYYNSRYDLGIGWAFQFPSVQSADGYLYYHDGQGAVYQVDFSLSDGLGRLTHLIGYQGTDITFNNDSGTFSNGVTQSAYYLQYNDQKREYFAQDGYLLGIVDRFGNTITFQHTDRAMYDDKTYKVISSITDSVGRVVTFDYENTLNSDNFNGEKITVTVNGNQSEKVVYTKWRAAVTFNGNPKGYAPVLDNITKHPLNEYAYFTYDSLTGRFNYDLKDWTGAGSNSYHSLASVQYPYSTSFYKYNLDTRNLGTTGQGEEVRVESRRDQLSGGTKEYNKLSYSYTGDYTAYKAPLDYNYRFSSTATVVSPDSVTNGQSTTYIYNGLQQLLSTIQSAPNGERKEIRNVEFSPTLKYRASKIQYLDFGAGDTDATANVLYKEVNFAATGAVLSETKPLPINDFNIESTKLLYKTVQTYDSPYFFQTRKEWYQSNSTKLAESYSYTEYGRLASYTNALNETTTYTYEPIPGDARKVSKVTEEKKLQDGTIAKTITTYGSQYSYAYPTEIISKFTNVSADGTRTASSVTKTITYDLASGRVLSETDGSGTTSYTYDSLGRVQTVIYPTVTNLNGEKYDVQDQFNYTQIYGNGSPFDTTNSNTYYLKVNSKQKYTRKSDNSVTYLNQNNDYYDGFGVLRLSQKVDTGAVTQYHIDDLVRPVYVIDPVNNTTTVSYDAWGRQKEAFDVYGNLYVTEYQLKQRKLISFIVPADSVSLYRSVPTANAIKKSYLEQNYDAWGYLLSRVTYKDISNPNVTGSRLEETYTYDIAGNVIKYTDPNKNQNSDGVTTTYSYDNLNRLSSVKDSLDQVAKYQYDRNGQITSTTVQAGVSGTPITLNTKVYNELGLPTIKKDNSAQKESITYNSLGLVEKKQDRNGTIEDYSYDESKQLVSSVFTGSGGAKQELRLIVGSSGIMNSTSQRIAGGETVSQVSTIDSIKRLSKLASSSTSGYSASTSYGYDLADRTTMITSMQSSISTYTKLKYDKLLLNQVQTDGKETVNSTASANVTYQYDALGNVKVITYPTLSNGIVLKTEYQYDQLNRLESMKNLKGTAVISSFVYTYDNNGNITYVTETRNGASAQTTHYIYDKLNRLKTIELPNGSGVADYTYDLKGNRQTVSDTRTIPFEDVETNYSYDLQNMLNSIIKGTATTTFNYLPNGLRYQKKSNITTQYNYNGAGQVISEVRSDGQKAAYIRGDRLLVKKDLTLTKDYYYLYNGHGDVIQIVDSSGSIVNNYTYDEWGNITSQSEGVSNSFKYAGEIFDTETGLYYLRARYYDPSVGRFLNEDTYEGQIDNPLSQNLYTYVHNNPLSYSDPSGHMPHKLLNAFLSDFIGGRPNGTNYTSAELANAVFNANGNNDSGRYKSFHEIAQIYAAKQIHLESGQAVQLEFHLEEEINNWPNKHHYVDIVTGDSLMWEVKAMRVNYIGLGDGAWEDAEAQLLRYNSVNNELQRGYQLNDISGIVIVDQLRMDIQFTDLGKIIYSFYLDYGDKGIMPLTTQMAADYVSNSSVYPPSLPDIDIKFPVKGKRK